MAHLTLRATPSCLHDSLQLECSSHATKVKYVRHAPLQLSTAAGKSKSGHDEESSETFPAPLILPNDDLALDPGYPPQSFRSWQRLKERNEITTDRKIIYVAASPSYIPENPTAKIIHSWSVPQVTDKMPKGVPPNIDGEQPRPPCTQHVMEYLAAFYHGIEVRELFTPLSFVNWDDYLPKKWKARRKAKDLPSIALSTSTELIRIRVRSCPDDTFLAQLDLNDLLDATMSLLPDDAYALLMLVDHDLYEDDDDDFCCGRAYGGSRIAVVSSARYNPALDEIVGLNREHSWPASHCGWYNSDLCNAKLGLSQKKSASLPASPPAAKHASPLRLALSAHTASFPSLVTTTYLKSLYLFRLCKTASHELGHCFGIDRCVYYACIMQGTASMAEDVRQPPYLCPIDLAKVRKALALNEDGLKGRYHALRRVCENLGPALAGYDAWIKGRLEGLGEPANY